ncbi:hypothetical protein MNB_SM-3-494 [hydrothermal vent metagenome]|uniref:Coenzyme PQQ synthesis protein D (PqqD) n=1 Tax=hydrothermal vent metagenome TaxID=652676 RepID=A0A1W1D1U0_9ZZZZ
MDIVKNLVLDENNIAFNPMMGNSYQLNDVSKDIVVLLQQGKSKDEIVNSLTQTYDVSAEELFIDVSDFIAKLKVYGLA